MKTHLIFTPYRERNIDRKVELESCYNLNFNAGFDYVTLVVEDNDIDYARQLCPQTLAYNSSFFLERTEGRPKFQDYINIANNISNSQTEPFIHIVCNSDIYFLPEELKKIKNLLPWDKNLFVTLARYDETKSGSFVLLDRRDTADCWVWKGLCPIKDAHCPIGVPGVDNSLAWKAKEAGYNVVNPSRDIRIIHRHLVPGNNYRKDSKPDGVIIADMICPEPYHFVSPHHIHEIQ